MDVKIILNKENILTFHQTLFLLISIMSVKIWMIQNKLCKCNLILNDKLYKNKQCIKDNAIIKILKILKIKNHKNRK
jgi:hypothetical protein